MRVPRLCQFQWRLMVSAIRRALQLRLRQRRLGSLAAPSVLIRHPGSDLLRVAAARGAVADEPDAIAAGRVELSQRLEGLSER